MRIRHAFAAAAFAALAGCGPSSEESTVTGEGNLALLNEMEAESGDNMMGAAGAGMAANAQDYTAKAAASDMYEIESARLANRKSQNADVKQLAEMIMTDHEKATADLRAAAGQVQPPITVAPQMNAEQQSMMQALQAAAAGTEFDRTYLQQQVQAHQQALAMVQGYARSGETEGLKQHAATVAGPIQRHLQRAQELQTSVGR